MNESKKIHLAADQRNALNLAIENSANTGENESLKKLWEAAKLLRKDMLNTRKNEKWILNGSVKSDHTAIPEFLQVFIEWIHAGGRDLSGYRKDDITRAATTIGQI